MISAAANSICGSGPRRLMALFHPAISVQASRGIGLAFAHPLLVGFGQVADVEPREGVRVTSGIRVRRALLKSRDQLLRYLWVMASIDCRPA